MKKVYVLIHKNKDDELDVQVFSDKETPTSKVMETMYGEDWEIQSSDETWELYGEIQNNLDTLWYGGEVWMGDEESWTLVESELQN